MKLNIIFTKRQISDALGISKKQQKKLDGRIYSLFEDQEKGDLLEHFDNIAAECNTIEEIAYFFFWAGRCYEMNSCIEDEDA